MDSTDFSIFSKKGEGGVIGGHGYSFQDAYVVSKIPTWLESNHFVSLIKEGIEDVDIRFRIDGSDSFHYIQVKSIRISLPKFREILEEFHSRDSKDEYLSKFILACRGFEPKSESIRRRINDFRETIKIHQREKLFESEESIKKDMHEYGINIPFDFLLEKVFFDTELGDMRSDILLSDQFVGAMKRIKTYEDVNHIILRNIFRSLSTILNFNIRQVIDREKIESIIEESRDYYAKEFNEKGITIRMFHWEDYSYDLSNPWNLLLDWSDLFDRKSRTVPESQIWKTVLIPELEKAEKEIRRLSDSRKIIFYPSACLSAGFALGYAFKEVKGYSFDIHQGNAIWTSDIEPSENVLEFTAESMDPDSSDLCIECNISAYVNEKVDRYIERTSMKFFERVSITPDIGVGKRINNAIALAYAFDFKNKLRELIRGKEINKVHIFYAGPLGISILIGWLFNALQVQIQCYEEQINTYIATCLLDAS